MKGLYGDLQSIAEGPMKAMKDYPDYFVGIGAFMEGIDQNVVVYDLIYVWFPFALLLTGNGLAQERGSFRVDPSVRDSQIRSGRSHPEQGLGSAPPLHLPSA